MLWPAVILGFLGSFHCLGMCGPIVFALRGRGWAHWRFLTGRMLYNMGRIVTYSALGAVVALLGMSAGMFHFQQGLSIVIGILLLLWAFSEAGWLKRIGLGGQLSRGVSWIKGGFSKFWQMEGLPAQFMVGIFNGMLPCGLVYLAMAYAAMAATPWEGAAFMALFGAGTLPMMLAVAFSAKVITPELRQKVVKAIPYFIMVFAVLFILRGMNLGIPYLSPHMTLSSGEAVVSCHE